MRGFLIVWIRCLQATAGLSVFGSVVVRTGGAGISQGFFHQRCRMDLNHLHIARGLERLGWVSTGGGWAGAATWVGSNISSILDAPDRDSHQSTLTKTVISHQTNYNVLNLQKKNKPPIPISLHPIPTPRPLLLTFYPPLVSLPLRLRTAKPNRSLPIPIPRLTAKSPKISPQKKPPPFGCRKDLAYPGRYPALASYDHPRNKWVDG